MWRLDLWRDDMIALLSLQPSDFRGAQLLTKYNKAIALKAMIWAKQYINLMIIISKMILELI